MSTVAIRERPILFSSPMIRAILEGRKRQTRRVLKWPQGQAGECLDGYDWSKDCNGKWGVTNDGIGFFDPLETFKAPFGRPGDRLWVRENFLVQPALWAEGHGPQPIHYSASTPKDQAEDYVGKPCIHMPRWASRILLEITDVRVQRLQEITEEDAKAEGARFWPEISDPHPYKQGARWSMAAEPPASTDHCLGTARFAFGSLWNSLNEARGFGWKVNPHVWVIDFKRCSP